MVVTFFCPCCSTKIVWNDAKCLTKKVLTFNPTKGSKKPIVITENCDSFFNFFSPPEVPDDNKKFDVHKVSSTFWMSVLMFET
jgi:hypothetical protein